MANGGRGPFPGLGPPQVPVIPFPRQQLPVRPFLHDLALATFFFPRILVLDRGRLVGDGPPSTVLAPDVVREIFGVDPRLLRLAAPEPEPA